jgi:hypothetical protein
MRWICTIGSWALFATPALVERWHPDPTTSGFLCMLAGGLSYDLWMRGA